MGIPEAHIANFRGYRRGIRIVSDGVRSVLAELEDDIHAFAVSLSHDGCKILALDVEIRRAPWSTCPGAERVLKDALVHMKLNEVYRYPHKKQQCTHLMDLAIWGAQYTSRKIVVEYDALVHDAVEGVRHAEIWRDGERLMEWDEAGFVLSAPPEVAGCNLFGMNEWLKTLDPTQQEAVRILRWANMIANGRAMTLAEQSDATRMPPNCYSFQPKRAASAKRVGVIKDFSFGHDEPLKQTTNG